MTSLTDPLGNVTTYQYDEVGRLVSQSDPVGDNSGYVNDSCDRLTKQVDVLGNDVRYGYDDGGNLLFVQDQNGHQTQAERAGGRAFEPRRHRHRQHGGRGPAAADVERQVVER